MSHTSFIIRMISLLSNKYSHSPEVSASTLTRDRVASKYFRGTRTTPSSQRQVSSSPKATRHPYLHNQTGGIVTRAIRGQRILGNRCSDSVTSRACQQTSFHLPPFSLFPSSKTFLTFTCIAVFWVDCTIIILVYNRKMIEKWFGGCP